MNQVRRLIEDYVPRDEREKADRMQMLTFMEQCGGWLTRENAVAHVTASAWITDPARTKALMVYHNIYDSWSWTGGHADGDSDLLRVALREAREETGAESRPVIMSPISIESVCVNSHVKRGKTVSAHIHMNVTFLLEADSDAPVAVKPDENSAVSWIAFDEVANSVSEPEMIPIYNKLISRAREC